MGASVCPGSKGRLSNAEQRVLLRGSFKKLLAKGKTCVLSCSQDPYQGSLRPSVLHSPENVCQPISKQVCNDVNEPRQVCNDVPEEVCDNVPASVTKYVDDEQCSNVGARKCA